MLVGRDIGRMVRRVENVMERKIFWQGMDLVRDVMCLDLHQEIHLIFIDFSHFHKAFGSTFYLQGELPTKGGTYNNGSFGTDINAAITASKLEDVATSPLEPTKVVLAEQLSGVYELDFNIQFIDGIFSAATSSFSITELKMKLSNPDNVEWAADGSIYAMSDDETGSVMRMTSDGKVSEIATCDGEG